MKKIPNIKRLLKRIAEVTTLTYSEALSLVGLCFQKGITDEQTIFSRAVNRKWEDL